MYREAAEIPPEPPDHEALAFAEIARRARRVRLVIGVPAILGGIVLGGAAYFGLREVFFSMIGAHSPYVTGILSTFPVLLLAWKVATSAARGLIAQRTGAWVAELSKQHQVAPEPLEEFARAL